MEKIVIDLKDKLLKNIRLYNSNEEEFILNAFNYAYNLHNGTTRQSGEPYITHPLEVAIILSEMHADRDTICAALLHDTLEDTSIKKEDIAENFNKDIANLVDGVTKISKMNFSTKQAQNLANTRKIVTSITDDVRIIVIKLADRLHNMRTLQFKSEYKQKENSLETIEIFVPFAYYIGAYRIKSELEDLSLRYLMPDIYKKIYEQKLTIEIDSKSCLNQMVTEVKEKLKKEEIENEIKVRTKNIYGIHKRLSEGHKLTDIHDLLSLKLMVTSISECYQSLGIIHSLYNPINDKFKDFIFNPKTNMYRSIHTTVFGPDDRLVQTQIRTFDMDKIASFGLTAYWDINKGKARDIMQEDLKDKFQFFKSLVEIDDMFGDNQEFVVQVKNELFSNKVYVYTTKGEIIELPIGSTPIDFAYKLNLGDNMIAAIINDKNVSLDYQLKNKDRVRIITNDLSSGPKEEWIDIAKTSYAKKKIKEYNKK